MKVSQGLLLGVIVYLVTSSGASAQIYKWKDADGKTHFGQRPPNVEDADQIKSPVSTVSSNSFQSVNGPEIVIYTTAWCGYCKKAKAYFAANKISYKEYDIEEDRFAKRAYERMGGEGVPLILVGDQRLTGFSERRFDSAYKRAQSNAQGPN